MCEYTLKGTHRQNMHGKKKNIKSYLWGKRGKQNWGARHKDFKIHFSVLFQGREAEVQKQI